MKRSIIAAVTAATISLSAFAFAQQDERHPPRMERMFEELQLTEEQQQQVQQIMDASRQQHQAIFEDTKAQMATILTQEQLDKMESRHHEGPRGKKRDHCDDEDES
ncbi:hypothetical protein BTA51_12495 [Hahella sp. CCB-MM4]|uniref:periplasmic heavy metal sensor n=1 Tax=Hahella sp. (strain CCB-MM4) TaxID=1926491 RepID=UPI000B9AB22C|nr:periplasmic heavy metal sensor [Hahella sp. CCB-MM4]OZG73289.1 hypothetical protein BTA51_12495 [Hahella sp. CCB-MM4]